MRPDGEDLLGRGEHERSDDGAASRLGDDEAFLLQPPQRLFDGRRRDAHLLRDVAFLDAIAGPQGAREDRVADVVVGAVAQRPDVVRREERRGGGSPVQAPALPGPPRSG